MQQISLSSMTAEMYHSFFREYENDPALTMPGQEYVPYCYNEEKVNAYIQRQIDWHRIPFAVMCGEEIIGELKIWNIKDHESAALGIAMKNPSYMNRGYGTQAERLAINYVFYTLDIPVLYADSILSNTRSQHVLEKAGFRQYCQDDKYKYYRIRRA